MAQPEQTNHSPMPAASVVQPARSPELKWVGLVVFGLVVVVLAFLTWDDVSQPRFEDGDFAANSILIDRAMSLDLLHGNYSRAGFYHPGPGLLYVQAIGQALFFEFLHLTPTPYNGHLLSILLLNAAMLTLTATILYRNTLSIWSPALLLYVAFAYSLNFANPGLGGLLASTWMPHVYVWPFLLLLVSSASVATGRGEDLWVLMLSAGLLVHGHVSFLLPVAGILTWVVARWFQLHRRGWFRAIPRASGVAAGLVLALTLLPVALLVITDFPGEFDDYLRYVRNAELPPRGLGDVARALAGYWGFGAGVAVFVPLLFIGGLAAASEIEAGSRRVFMLGLVWAGFIATAATAFYALRGVDDLSQSYILLFYVAVPVLMWTVLGTALVDRIVRNRPVVLAVVTLTLAMSWIVVLRQADSGSLYGGSEVGLAYRSIDRLIDGDARLALSLAEHSAWPAMVGILEQSRRDGRATCALLDHSLLEIVITEEMVCGDDSADPREVLVSSKIDPPTPTASLIFDGDRIRVWSVDG